MSILKFNISSDPVFYQAWPDLVQAADGRLICVFNQCLHHGNRQYTRIMQTESNDHGRNWSPVHPITEGTAGLPYYYNCPRLSRLPDGRLAFLVDRLPADGGEKRTAEAENMLCFSNDGGRTWSQPVVLPLHGIVPDKLRVLDCGRWLVTAHRHQNGRLAQFLHYSDDCGRSWSPAVTVAASASLHLCEASLLALDSTTLVAFLRENSGRGFDCYKVLSHDNGASWSEPIPFPLPGCHRPVAGKIQDGSILITYRFLQGGKGWLGTCAQNFFAALTDRESVLAASRADAWCRILPIDYDRSPHADLGYSGWTQFEDGEIYIVNYIVDDAVDRGQIRGYALRPETFYLPTNNNKGHLL